MRAWPVVVSGGAPMEAPEGQTSLLHQSGATPAFFVETMRPKPPECADCPMWQDGRGFVPDEIVPDAPVFVVGQNPGADEEREGRPFVGKTGQQMEAEFFPRAGLRRGENVSIGNLLRCRLIVNGQRTNVMPKGAALRDAINHCTRAHLRVPPGTRLIVAQGAYAWAALGGGVGPVSVWRGFLAPTGYAEAA